MMRMIAMRKTLLRRRLATHALMSTSAKALDTAFDVSAKQLSSTGQHSRVVFGVNAARDHLGAIARSSGIRKMLVVRDKDAGAAARTQYVEFLLLQAGIPCFQHTLTRDCTTLDGLDDAHATAQRVGADGVLAFGGGNTMDMARGVAFMLANGGNAADYVRTDSDSSDLAAPVPLLLVPTIAGSGAEMALDALVLDEDAESKQSFVETPIIATAVIIDPMLALSVPLQLTVQGALTALGQCIESYVLGSGESTTEDPTAEVLALQGIEIIATALAQPLVDGVVDLKSVGLREKLALGSLFSAIAATSTGAGGANALAVSMGGISDLPHAHVASTMLPCVLDQYATLASDNRGDAFFDSLNARLERVATRLTTTSGFQGASVAAWVRYVATRFDLPTTSSLELHDASLVAGIVDRALQRQDATRQHRGLQPILEADDIRAIVDAAITIADAKELADKATPSTTMDV